MIKHQKCYELQDGIMRRLLVRVGRSCDSNGRPTVQYDVWRRACVSQSVLSNTVMLYLSENTFGQKCRQKRALKQRVPAETMSPLACEILTRLKFRASLLSSMCDPGFKAPLLDYCMYENDFNYVAHRH